MQPDRAFGAPETTQDERARREEQTERDPHGSGCDQCVLHPCGDARALGVEQNAERAQRCYEHRRLFGAHRKQREQAGQNQRPPLAERRRPQRGADRERHEQASQHLVASWNDGHDFDVRRMQSEDERDDERTEPGASTQRSAREKRERQSCAREQRDRADLVGPRLEPE